MEKKRLQELANVRINESTYTDNYAHFHHACIDIRQAMVKHTGGYESGTYKDKRIAEFKKLEEKMEDIIEAIMGNK
jgi:hypothetical protein